MPLAIPEVSVKPMAPFMASLAPQKFYLRKVLEDSFRRMKDLSR